MGRLKEDNVNVTPHHNKHIIKLSLIFSFFIWALPAHTSQEGKRVYFYSCHLERTAQDERFFKEKFIFQITQDHSEMSTAKKFLRWADIEISLWGTGRLQILISETSKDGTPKSHKESFLLPQFSIDRPTLLNKNIVPNFPGSVRYSLSCR